MSGSGRDCYNACETIASRVRNGGIGRDGGSGKGGGGDFLYAKARQERGQEKVGETERRWSEEDEGDRGLGAKASPRLESCTTRLSSQPVRSNESQDGFLLSDAL